MNIKSRSLFTTVELSPPISGPWTMYFVYAPNGNFLVKGGDEVVQDYVKTNFPHCIYRYTFWKNGKSRGDWRSQGLFLRKRHDVIWFWQSTKSAKFILTSQPLMIDNQRLVNKIKFFYRRLPRKWLPEWNQLIMDN